MTFKKGDPRPAGAGRVKGKPTKKEIAAKARLDEIFAKQDFNVETELVAAIKRGDVAMARVLTGLLPYLQPRVCSESPAAPKPEQPTESDEPVDLAQLMSVVPTKA